MGNYYIGSAVRLSSPKYAFVGKNGDVNKHEKLSKFKEMFIIEDPMVTLLLKTLL
jgi:hypothetical protein